MISIEVKRKGNLENFVKNLSAAVMNGVDSALENTHKEAIAAKHMMTHGGGELDKNVVIEKINDFEGRVFTNHEGLVFVEYGTGYKKDDDFPHIGTTKTFKESNYSFWLVPVDKVDKPIGPRITIGENEFYMAFSQAAKPFMRTTAFNRRYDNVEEIAKAIAELIKDNTL